MKMGKQMRKVQEPDATGQLCLGLILTVVGIALIGAAGLQPVEQALNLAFYIAGFAAFVGGMALIWKDLLDSAALPNEKPAESPDHYLGKFRLNGCQFEAFERQGEYGNKQFRLVSTPRMSAEREAACVRYLVNEGLIEELWPRSSRKIAEEADWAFFA